MTDLDKEFDDTLEKLEKIAKKNKTPLFVSCAVKNTKNDTEYKTALISPFYLGVTLTKDFFPEYLLVQNGFKVKRVMESDTPEELL